MGKRVFMSQKVWFKVLFCFVIAISVKTLLAEKRVMCAVMFSELKEKLHLPVLVVNTLERGGINTVENLTLKTPE